MLNPANSLLASQEEVKNKKDSNQNKRLFRESGIKFLPVIIFGVILVVCILSIVLFSNNLAPYLEKNPSQGLLDLLPQDPYFLLCLKLNRTKPYALSGLSSGSSHHLLKEIEALDREGRMEKVLRDFNIGRELLDSGVEEAALAQYKREEKDFRILVLTSQDPQKTRRFLSRYDFLEYSSHRGVAIYRNSRQGRVSHYTERQNYFIFSSREDFLKEVINLQDNRKYSVASSADFRRAWRKIDIHSPIFVYTKQEGWPISLSIAPIQDNTWEINAFYPEENIKTKTSDASWYRFIPPDAIGVLRGNTHKTLQDSLRKAGLDHSWQDVISSLDFSKFEEDLAQSYNLDWQAEINSLIKDDFEMIAIPNQDSYQEIALIVPWKDELKSRLEEIEQALGVIATSQNPRKEEVVLPDGTLITEYVRDPEQDYVTEQDIAGIKVSYIDFGREEKRLFYGRLGNKLVFASSSDAFSKIVSSFRKSAESSERIIPPEFLEGQEWFYFDLEKLSYLPLSNYLRKVQGISLLESDGTLVKLWLDL